MSSDLRTAESGHAGATVQNFSIPLRVAASASGAGCEPVSFGVPIPRGKLATLPADVSLVSSDGLRISCQAEPLAHWPDGSIQWLLVDALLAAGCAGAGEWRVKFDAGRAGEGEKRIALIPVGAGWRVDTGSECFDVAPAARFLRAGMDEGTGLSEAAEVVLTDRKGREHVPRWKSAVIETRGPVRTTLVLAGDLPRLRGLEVRLRLSFFAGTATVRVDVTLHNSRRARHRGGLWDLGDAGSHLFEDFSLRMRLAEGIGGPIRYRLANSSPAGTARRSLNIYQDSSGGDNWQSRAHVNRHGENCCRFRGCRIAADNAESHTDRVSPQVAVTSGKSNVTVAIPEFWQQFPKSLRVEEGEIRVGLFPREFDDLHELQGGERKTHTIWIDCCRSVGCDLSWVFAPTVVSPTTDWCEASAALPAMCTRSSPAGECFETILSEALEGDRSILANRERVDEYGWRNFGEVFADHEQAHYHGAEPLVSHYNNQFDMVQGFLLQFLRTGEKRWFNLSNELARHVMDIDIYHTVEDRSAYSGGMFWLTDHYVHAHTATHRTYSRANRPADGRPYGGGPAAQHNFTTGLLLYHLLTGHRDARDAVIGLADWVIRMEDGRRTILGIVDDGPTGLATLGSDPTMTGPGRGGANSINALLDAWKLTGERKYLLFAESLIRRCIHPADDVENMDLLNVELSWSYTMFLVATAKYLQAKELAGELDDNFVLARDSLIHYARWMNDNERPYFDQVEKLEYPTEAWAAQELRKANVFRWAARYAEEPLRSSLLAGGDEFGDRAWADLTRFGETRMYARAVAIVMTEGLFDCISRSRTLPPAPVTPSVLHSVGRSAFVPQKQRVLSKVRSSAGLIETTRRVLNPYRWYCWNRRRRPNRTSRDRS